jgi:hypothetical protein
MENQRYRELYEASIDALLDWNWAEDLPKRFPKKVGAKQDEIEELLSSWPLDDKRMAEHGIPSLKDALYELTTMSSERDISRFQARLRCKIDPNRTNLQINVSIGV